jgi:hypothetical protein
MKNIIINPTTTAQWQVLVHEAESACALQLNEDLESYLVFLLMRFTQRPEIAKSVLALEFLQSLHRFGQIRSDMLREVGDKCLIFSGFFPEQSKRRCLPDNYFIHLGQTAYDALSQVTAQHSAELYHLLSISFNSLRNVLHAMHTQPQVVQVLDHITYVSFIKKISH